MISFIYGVTKMIRQLMEDFKQSRKILMISANDQDIISPPHFC